MSPQDSGPGSWRVRAVRPDDADGVAALVDDGSDPLFVAQDHRLHGPPRDGRAWRRTLVAEHQGRVIGAVTAARNPLHPGRYRLAVEVARDVRRRGVAGSLVAAAGRIRAEPLPFAAKIRPADPAATAFLAKLGGRAYQSCPGLRPDPAAAELRRWCQDRPVPAGLAIRQLTDRSDWSEADWTRWWIGQYLWVHRGWSPADPGVLAEEASMMLADLDPDLTTVAWRADGADAIAWVFREGPGAVTVVAETVRPSVADGTAAVRAALARCLLGLAAAGIALVELDGHDTAPHLAPVLRTLPPGSASPLLLVEF